jgi:hypothetical protein
MLTTLIAAALLQSPTAPLPKELVGEWRWTSISGVTFWDSKSSAYQGHGGGMSDTYIIAADGTYKEYAYIEQTPTAGWTVKTFTTTEGRIDTEDGYIRFTTTKGKYKVEDSRVASRNYERPMKEDEVKKNVKVNKYSTRTEGGKRLFVKHFTNEEMKYERVR